MRRFAMVSVGVMSLSLVAFMGAPQGWALGDPTGGSGRSSRSAAGTVPAVLQTVKITFNSVASSGNPMWTHLSTSGYSFDGNHFHTIDSPSSCTFGGCVDNGTIYIGEEEGGLGQPFTMTRETGGKFKLKKVQLAQLFIDDAAAASGGFPNATSVTLTGTKGNGSHVIASFPPPDTGFATFVLPLSFRGLVSVLFSANGGFGADNIVIRQSV